jgi:hypothetical protein
MRPLVYWARAEKWRVRPMEKTEREIRGVLIDPNGRPHRFRYDRETLLLEIESGDKAGRWQLDRWGVPARIE